MECLWDSNLHIIAARTFVQFFHNFSRRNISHWNMHFKLQKLPMRRLTRLTDTCFILQQPHQQIGSRSRTLQARARKHFAFSYTISVILHHVGCNEWPPQRARVSTECVCTPSCAPSLDVVTGTLFTTQRSLAPPRVEEGGGGQTNSWIKPNKKSNTRTHART